MFLLHICETFHRFGEFLYGRIRVAMFNPVADAVFEVAFKHHFSGFVEGGLCGVYLGEDSQGMSSSTIRSMAWICPMIFASLRCRFAESIHCFIIQPPYCKGYMYYSVCLSKSQIPINKTLHKIEKRDII